MQLCVGDWIGGISDADELTPYAVTTRYPGIDDRVTRKDAVYAVNLAKKVRKVVRRVLRTEGLFNKNR
jgi:HEPN domain-containing protein